MLQRIAKRLQSIVFGRKLKKLDTEGRFTEIYKSGWWKNDTESISGTGSSLENTKHIREALPVLITKYGVQSMLDAPCGDYYWMREVKFPNGFVYIGGDIVKPMIEELSVKYGDNPNVSFKHVDLIKDQLPFADMLFCRDCLFHLSFEDIFAALDNMRNSDIDFFMLTQMPNLPANKDIITGRHRLLNLQAAPFNLPEPIETIVDYTPPRAHKLMAIWTRDQLDAALKAAGR